LPFDQRDLHTELRAAIGAHGVWKQRLRTAIRTGSRSLDPDTLCRDDACRFGQWLSSLPTETAAHAVVRRTAECHRRFHQAAGQVASLALAGRPAEASAMLDQGAFHDASEALALALADWLRAR
jgi:Chemoreceptor zinc-binding domain